MHFCKEVEERDASTVIAFSTACLLVYGDDHPSFPTFRCPSRTPGQLTHMNKPKNSFSVQDFEHFRSDFIEACSIFSALITIKTSLAVMVFSTPKCNSSVSNGMFKRLGSKGL